MLVRDIMTHGAECVAPDTSLREAARLMRDLDVGALPVRGAGDGLAGVVTDRDLAVRGLAAGLDPDRTTVAAVMSAGVVTCFAGHDAAVAAGIMEDGRVRRLVVLDPGGEPVGVLSFGDLARRHTDRPVPARDVDQVYTPTRSDP